MLITEPYREMNRELLREGWGASAALFADEVKNLHEHLGGSVLDYGCGQGMLARTLPFTVREYDPCVAGKDGFPAPADLVVCLDVLEHVEPECLAEVLAHLHFCTQKLAFIVISTQPAATSLPDGSNAHRIVKPGAWWGERLREFFDLSSEYAEGGIYRCLARPLNR